MAGKLLSLFWDSKRKCYVSVDWRGKPDRFYRPANRGTLDDYGGPIILNPPGKVRPEARPQIIFDEIDDPLGGRP